MVGYWRGTGEILALQRGLAFFVLEVQHCSPPDERLAAPGRKRWRGGQRAGESVQYVMRGMRDTCYMCYACPQCYAWYYYTVWCYLKYDM
jgi:hypothetical protein